MKILKNQTISPIVISDVGVSIPASPSTYTIPEQDYLLWAASSNIVTYIGNGNVIVNDGSFDLSISDGIDLIKGLFPKTVSIDQDITGPLELNLQKTAFGELQVAQLRPYINISAVKGLAERILEQYTSGTGSFSGVHDHLPGREFEVESGTSVGGYGVLRSKKVVDYRGGIGIVARFTAKFSTPATQTIIRAGLNNIGNELAFGYSGTTFGILKKTGGRPEVRTLTLTQRATSSQTATITLNGIAVNVAVTNSSIEQNAFEIAQNVAYSGWMAYSIENTIVYQAQSTGAKTGTYSLTSTGNLAGTFSRTVEGLTEIEDFVSQANWSETTLTSGSDPFILNHQKGNVYQIQYQYLGYGEIRFFIENPETGTFIPVHKIKYANANTSPSLDLPNFKIGILAASTGSTTNVGVSTASMSVFSENMNLFPGKTHSQIATASGIGSTLTNLISFKKTTISNGVLNISDTNALVTTLAAEATNPIIYEIRLNASISGILKWKYADEDTPIIYATDNGTVTSGELLYSVALSKSSNISIDLKDLDIVLSNDDVLTIAVRATNGTVSAIGSFVWGENT